MTTRFLTFSLNAPMGSFGSAGPGKVRNTSAWPQKGAILGICAAALGIDRSDHDALNELYRLKLATVSTNGGIFIDYQTSTGARGSSDNVFEYRNKRGEHDETDPKTVKHFLVDIKVAVALWADDEAGEKLLEQLQNALIRPRYPLYLGRRCCPLGVIARPFYRPAESPFAALHADRPSFKNWMYHADFDPKFPDEATHDEVDQPTAGELRSFRSRPVVIKTIGAAVVAEAEEFNFDDAWK